MKSEQSLLAGLVALQRDLIDHAQFMDACTAWSSGMSGSLVEILVDRGWISTQQGIELEAIVDKRLSGRDGKTMGGDVVSNLMDGINDEELTRSLRSLDLPHPFKSPTKVDTAARNRSHYELTPVHKDGGFGRVWLAYDRQLQRRVALKEIRPDRRGGPDMEVRFLREAQITGQLEHPNIVPIYELIHSDADGPFYTMRFLRGQSLRKAISNFHRGLHGQRVARSSELTRLLNDFIAVCNAIGFAHSKGVIHRDLKPSNIMLGAFGEVHVLDWGLAKMVDADETDEMDETTQRDPTHIAIQTGVDSGDTRDGAILGSVPYLSPEQADGRGTLVDRKSDIYGLGAVLFEILTGRPPHTGQESSDIVRDIVRNEAPRTRDKMSYVPPPLDAICAKAMAKEPAARYETAQKLGDDVRRWLADEPVTALREPWSIMVTRWLRKHRAWTVPSAAALLAVAIISVGAALALRVALKKEQAALVVAVEATKAAEAAEKAERLAKTKATERLRDARHAVQAFLQDTSDELLNHPGLSSLRKRLLDQAVQDYARFTTAEDGDPALQMETGLAYLELGDIHRLRGDYVQARLAYEAGASLFAVLAADEPRNVAVMLAIANARGKLGDVLRIEGNVGAASQMIDLALKNYDDIIALPVAPAEAWLNKADLCISRGRVLGAQGRWDDAIEAQMLGNREFDDLVQRQDRPLHRFKRAEAMGALGSFLTSAGRPAEAVPHIRRAIDELNLLLSADAENPDFLETRAVNSIYLGNVSHPLGHVAEEERAYRAAIRDYEALKEKHDDVPHYRLNLALTLTSLAAVMHDAGRNTLAKDYADEAISHYGFLLRNYTNTPQYLEGAAASATVLGLALADLDSLEQAEFQYREVIKVYSTLIQDFRSDPRYQRGLGTAQTHLGRLLYQRENWDEARDMFQAALASYSQAQPENPLTGDGLAWCHTYLGDTLRKLSQTDEARESYGAALEIRRSLQEQPENLYALARFLANCHDETFRDADAAIVAARAATERAEENPSYWHALALAHFRAGDANSSLESLTRAQSIRQQHPRDLILAAMIQHRLGNVAGSLELFSQATSCDLMMQNLGNIELRTLREEASQLLDNAAE